MATNVGNVLIDCWTVDLEDIIDPALTALFGKLNETIKRSSHGRDYLALLTLQDVLVAALVLFIFE